MSNFAESTIRASTDDRCIDLVLLSFLSIICENNLLILKETNPDINKENKIEEEEITDESENFKSLGKTIIIKDGAKKVNEIELINSDPANQQMEMRIDENSNDVLLRVNKKLSPEELQKVRENKKKYKEYLEKKDIEALNIYSEAICNVLTAMVWREKRNGFPNANEKNIQDMQVVSHLYNSESSTFTISKRIRKILSDFFKTKQESKQKYNPDDPEGITEIKALNFFLLNSVFEVNKNRNNGYLRFNQLRFWLELSKDIETPSNRRFLIHSAAETIAPYLLSTKSYVSKVIKDENTKNILDIISKSTINETVFKDGLLLSVFCYTLLSFTPSNIYYDKIKETNKIDIENTNDIMHYNEDYNNQYKCLESNKSDEFCFANVIEMAFPSKDIKNFNVKKEREERIFKKNIEFVCDNEKCPLDMNSIIFKTLL